MIQPGGLKALGENDVVKVGSILPAILDPAGSPSGPVYAPPNESRVEDVLAWHAVKYRHPDVRFDKQVWVSTICGRFRLDLVAEGDGYRVALKCDGEQCWCG